MSTKTGTAPNNWTTSAVAMKVKGVVKIASPGPTPGLGRDPQDSGRRRETLYDDADAVEAPCTARAIIYNGFAIAALIASQVKKWSKTEELKREIIFDLKTLALITN